MFRRIVALLLLSSTVWAGSNTTNAGIYKPADSETGWGEFLRDDFDIIDSSFAILPINLGTGVTGALPSENMVSTAVFTSKENFFTDVNHFHEVAASSVSVSGNVNINSLTANQCVQTSAGGLLTTTGAACS